MRINRRRMLIRTAGLGAAAVFTPRRSSAARATASVGEQMAANGPMFVPLDDVKWSRMPPIPGKPVPAATDPWPEISILRVAPETKATQLLIRVPKNFHVPRHWHTANETHTVLKGTFIMECDGQRAELGPGGFNYMPSKMVHQGWTKPDQDMLVFITVDAAWDVNFVDA